MSNADDFFRNIAGEAYRTHNEIKRQGKMNDGKGAQVDPALERKLFILILGIIALVGVEAVKVFFRRNFGRDGLSMLRLSVCCLAFLALGGLALSISGDAEDARKITGGMDSQTSFIITGVFYIILALVTLVKGIQLRNSSIKLNLPPEYSGDSHLLRFMEKDNWSRENIQLIAEPLYVIAIGICFGLFVNILGGIPIILCGVSLWGYKIMESLFFGNRMQKAVVHQNEQLKGKDEFHEFHNVQ